MELAGGGIGDREECVFLVSAAGNDQWDTGLIDQNRIRLVNDGGCERAVDLAGGTEGHLISQIVKPHLSAGGIGDVRAIGGLPLGDRHSLLYVGDGQLHMAIDVAHPIGIAARQIVVDRHDVHAPAGAGVPGCGSDGGEGLPFAGLHLSDLAGSHRQRASELDIKHVLTQHA